jgi:hypothetical protein
MEHRLQKLPNTGRRVFQIPGENRSGQRDRVLLLGDIKWQRGIFPNAWAKYAIKRQSFPAGRSSSLPCE